jgi:hypothetical protein
MRLLVIITIDITSLFEENFLLMIEGIHISNSNHLNFNYL